VTSADSAWGKWGRRLLSLPALLLLIVVAALLAERHLADYYSSFVQERIAEEIEREFRVEFHSGGVEWSILSGEVALLDVAMYRETASGAPAGEPLELLLACQRVEVRLDWRVVVEHKVNLAVSLDGLRVGLTVVGKVQLHGGKFLGVHLEKPRSIGSLRIDRSDPVGVGVSTRTDVDS
jgi:hypothetical protein